MKIHDVTQGSGEWFAARIGIPTASNFEKILTPKELKASASRKPYLYFLLAERLLNRTLDSLEGQEWMERGKELEPMAAKMYEIEQDVSTRPIGFLTTDDGRTGASPDRLVMEGDKVVGLLEIKCPAPQNHVGYMLEGFGTKYMLQVQGQMLVSGLQWVDRYSFHPEMPPHRERTMRDETIIAALRKGLDEFNAELTLAHDKLLSSGLFLKREVVQTAVDAEYGERAMFGEGLLETVVDAPEAPPLTSEAAPEPIPPAGATQAPTGNFRWVNSAGESFTGSEFTAIQEIEECLKATASMGMATFLKIWSMQELAPIEIESRSRLLTLFRDLRSKIASKGIV